MNEDAQRYDPSGIEQALRENREPLMDLVERIETGGVAVGSLTKTEQLLLWMSLKLVMLRLG